MRALLQLSVFIYGIHPSKQKRFLLVLVLVMLIVVAQLDGSFVH